MEVIERFNEINIQYLDTLTFDNICSYFNSNMTSKDKKENYKKIKEFCKQHIKAKYEIKRLYTHSFKYQDIHEGRLFNGGSIQSIPKAIRGFLCKGLTTDIDQSMSHPTILRYLCLKHKIPCPNLTYYIDNRDLVYSDMDLRRDEAKKLFLAAVNKDTLNRKEKNDFFKAFDKEIKIIQKKLLNIDEYKYLKNCIDINKKYNKNGSAINKLLCRFENEILNTMISFIRSKNIEIHSLMFDGLMIYGDYYNNKELLNEIKAAVNEKFDGLNMCFTYKEHIEEIVIPSNFNVNDKNNIINKIKNDLDYYDNYKVEFEKTHAKIISQSNFVCYNSYTNTYQFLKRQNLLDSYEEITVKTIQKNNSGEYEIVNLPFIQKWLKDPNKKKYDDVDTIAPPFECPDNIFNLWTNFDMENINNYEKNDEAIEFFKNHIKILCNHDEIVYDYILKWIGQMIQYPGVKSGIVPIFIAAEGTGKGSLKELLKKMIGDKKILQTSQPSKDCWGAFNGQMKDSFLVNLDELNKKEFESSNDAYKALVSENTININIKGIKSFSIKSNHRYFVTTNNGDPVPTKKGDRRNLIVISSNELKNNVEYFNRFYKYLNNVDAVKSIYEYFKSIPDLDKFNMIEKPITEYQKDLEDENANPIEKWLIEYVKKNCETPLFEIKTNDLYEEFTEYKNKYYQSHRYTCATFSKQLIALNIPGIVRFRKSIGRFTEINIENVLKYFKMTIDDCLNELKIEMSDYDSDDEL